MTTGSHATAETSKGAHSDTQAAARQIDRDQPILMVSPHHPRLSSGPRNHAHAYAHHAVIRSARQKRPTRRLFPMPVRTPQPRRPDSKIRTAHAPAVRVLSALAAIAASMVPGCSASRIAEPGPYASRPSLVLEWWDSDAEVGRPLFLTGSTANGTEWRFLFREATDARISPDGQRCVVIGPPYCDHYLFVIDFSAESIRTSRTPTSAHAWRLDGFGPADQILCTRWSADDLLSDSPGRQVVYRMQDLVETDGAIAERWVRRTEHQAGGASDPRQP